MKRKLFLLVAFVFLFGVFAMTTRSAYAQSATNAPWTSSITYYTPSPTGATAVISYYAEGSATAVDVYNVTLSAHGAGSVFIGATAVPAGFQGGAVISSSETVVATGVLFAGSGQTGSYGRMLYSGFSESKAAATFFIPTVLYKTFGSTSALGIQNIESTTTVVTLKLYAAGSTTPTSTKVYNIPAQSSQVVSASELSLPVGFSGSATITTPGGRVVAVAQETDDAGRGAYAFEGVASGSTTVYMASMLCNAFGGQNSFYAIQNTGASIASVTISFYNTSGTVVATMPATNVGIGGKISVNPCTQGVPAGTSGSAVINSSQPVIAIGKVKAPNGLATAFVGESAGTVSSASPYIRWTNNASSEFRAFIAVMNVGTAAATNVTATYYNAAGTPTTVTLASNGSPLGQYIKVNTNAFTAGATGTNGEFGTAAAVGGVGGALEITSDQPVVVVVRLTRAVSLGTTTLFGEDYGATNIAP